MTRKLTPNQIVAFNLRRARGLRGWTQDIAAAHLADALGEQWSKRSFSAAERSVVGHRIKSFDADEIVAFAATFDVPIAFFFVVPGDGVEVIAAPTARRELTPDELAALAPRPEEREQEMHEEARRRTESMGIRWVEEPTKENT